MKEYQVGQRVRLPAMPDLEIPEQRAEVVTVARRALRVRIYESDRVPGDSTDDDGVVTVALNRQGEIVP